MNHFLMHLYNERFIMEKVNIEQLAKRTRMVIHGGHDYHDEEPYCSPYPHPILSIQIGNDVRHFKCTSINPAKKHYGLDATFYELKNPETCDLDKTFKAIKHPEIKPVVSLSHSVYLRNDETPPMKIYTDANNLHKSTDQTNFELSDEDKIGIMKVLVTSVMKLEKKRNEGIHVPKGIRKPQVPKYQCDANDRRWNNAHPSHTPHKIQVVNLPQDKLIMDDLYTDELKNKISKLIML